MIFWLVSMSKLLFRLFVLLGVIILCFATTNIITAQEIETEAPIYQVQDGDSLWGIAIKFGVSIDELAAINGLATNSGLTVGQDLLIPGLPGVQGRITTQEVNFGENFESLSRKYQISKQNLAKLNRLISPMQIYRGSEIILTEETIAQGNTGRSTLDFGSSLLEQSLLNGMNTWKLMDQNHIDSSWTVLEGENIFTAHGKQDGPGALPTFITKINLKPDRLAQGSTVVVQLNSDTPIQVSGALGESPLVFFNEGNDQYALQGIYALQEPGFYPLSISGELDHGGTFGFSQWVYIADGGYPYDDPLTVSPETIDPAVTEPENEQIYALTAPFSAEKQWESMFVAPVDAIYTTDFPSRYGSRRSYNGSPYNYFHTGLDFWGKVGNNIYAPAPGEVVFTGPLTVRGNTTVIDHGWGVYTIYMHQDEILVETGEMIETGQLIGRVGATGRVTGAHLHWEVWAGGIQVDPINWLQEVFP